MNRQDVFNKIWDYFIVNKNPKAGDNNTCYYRGPGGIKCFVGVLIPDDMYSPDMENKSAGEMLEKFPALMKHLDASGSDLFFLKILQDIHDYYTPDMWRKELNDFAITFDLQIPND
jgi:hypothetical protein